MKINDIRPDDVMADQAAAVEKDINWLKDRKDLFVKVPCPACGISDEVEMYEKFTMNHVCCKSCNTQYVNPRPPENMLAEFYSNSANYEYWAKFIFPASREARREKIFKPRTEIVRKLVKEYDISSGLMVEVGAAQGLFCEEITKLDIFDEIIAVEPTPELAKECRGLGLTTIESPWEQVQLNTPAKLIANFEVIEHLYDPAAFLKWCFKNLVDDGFLILTCPNIAGFEAMILGQESSILEHEHLNLFNPDSLSLLLKKCGFSVLEVATPGELDVELVQSCLDEKRITTEEIGPFFLQCINEENASVFQTFLKDAKLSSNMMLVAKK
jgi:2-polyprenyl-3-methyl-5-hydroxy-6-metoxy-1,4-benzoquinol methylase